MDFIRDTLTWLRYQELIDYSIQDFLSNLIIFMALAIPLFLLFWVYFKGRFQRRRIQFNRRFSSLSISEEVKNSVVSLMLFTAVDTIIYLAQIKGYTRVYSDINEYGWPYLVFSIVIIILFHDTYLYFVHRFMHLPKIYERVHKVHHLSTDPSPFAAFSFHPLEAVLEASVYVFIAFLLPVHIAALFTWQITYIVLSVIAHLGYEVYPKGFNRHWLFKFKTPSTHHNMHHAKVNGNYGLYFTWWDKLLGTEFKDYHQTYEAIFERKEVQKTHAPKPVAFSQPQAEPDAS
jgi:sterol desaturase/sphingolipid hydroxylase (fatty acid hydroxylase superfamily)